LSWRFISVLSVSSASLSGIRFKKIGHLQLAEKCFGLSFVSGHDFTTCGKMPNQKLCVRARPYSLRKKCFESGFVSGHDFIACGKMPNQKLCVRARPYNLRKNAKSAALCQGTALQLAEKCRISSFVSGHDFIACGKMPNQKLCVRARLQSCRISSFKIFPGLQAGACVQHAQLHFSAARLAPMPDLLQRGLFIHLGSRLWGSNSPLRSHSSCTNILLHRPGECVSLFFDN